jgi:hypothetical protein
MPTKRRQKLLREADAIKRALESLGGEQSIDAIREWIKTNAPDLDDEGRIGTLLRGYSNKDPDFGPAFLERTRQGHFKLDTSS